MELGVKNAYGFPSSPIFSSNTILNSFASGSSDSVEISAGAWVVVVENGWVMPIITPMPMTMAAIIPATAALFTLEICNFKGINLPAC